MRGSSQEYRGTLTVETAIVLPMFMFAMIALFYIVEAIRFGGNLEASMWQSARKMSVWAYAENKALKGNISSIGAHAISMSIGKAMVVSDLGENYIKESPVKGGVSGINFLRSSVFGSDQMIDLYASWTFDPPFNILGLRGMNISGRSRIRAFTGYDNTHRQEHGDCDEEVVFITDSGTVYHRDRNCPHINVTIKQTDISGVEKERNEYGGKYYRCEHCGSEKSDIFYITTDGDRYHTSATCPALKRSVKAVPLSDVTGMRGCKSCGGGI